MSATSRPLLRLTSHGGDDMEAKGNIVDHEYKIERDGNEVAEVSTSVVPGTATPTVSRSQPGQDDALVLAVVVCIDQMSHDVG